MNEDDWEEFKKQVEPLEKKQKIKTFLKKRPIIKVNFKEDETELHQVLEIEKSSREKLEKNTLKRIKKGKIKIDSTLDLHGNTLEESQKKVVRFVEENFNNQKRLVLIITGKGERSSVEFGWKGQGKLKENVPKWLNSDFLSKKVLWFDKAPPDKGGEGALLVYLKKLKV